MSSPTLDDLYHMTAHIFSEQNSDRPATATFAHFVEVCGMLSIHDRKKKREGINVTDALCKALGWFFPLMARFHVKSVEQLVFRKFPYACPYCRELPHRDEKCKVVKGTSRTVDHHAVQAKYQQNAHLRPKGLNEWQRMFADIYPRSAEERAGRSTIGLLEELGEMAEAVRVFERHPKYFAGEAADVFSYLMGIANEHALTLDQSEQKVFSFESEFLRRYPGLCVQCGYQICVCPAVPDSTVGRMAKELELNNGASLFGLEPEAFEARGVSVADEALANMGGYPRLAALPFDRGEVNSALVVLCLRLSDALEASDPVATAKLRSIALTAASALAPAGSREHSGTVAKVLSELQSLTPQVQEQITAALPKEAAPLAHRLGALLTRKRVLLVLASPKDQDPLRLQTEERAIKEAIQLSQHRDSIQVKVLPAATTDDLRRELLQTDYDILHFSGHGAKDASLIFEDPAGGTSAAPFSSIRGLVARYPSIVCVILNACHSLNAIKEPIAPVTVGMDAVVDDPAAIEFARGFYDALGANKGVLFAVAEGRSAVDLKGLSGGLPLVVLTSTSTKSAA